MALIEGVSSLHDGSGFWDDSWIIVRACLGFKDDSWMEQSMSRVLG
jgi:hypothetical protein